MLQWARGEPDLKRLLIVVLTSSHLQSDVDRAYELGANSYLVKPVAFEGLLSLVRTLGLYWIMTNEGPAIVEPPG